MKADWNYKEVPLYLQKLLFAFLYGLLVLLLTFLFSHLPVGVSLEDKLYDSLQQKFTIDSKSNILFSHYKNEIDKLLFINLGSSFFDKENDRLQQDSLAYLLEKIKIVQDGYDALFLDYAYEKNYTKNQNLDAALGSLKSKLVLPLTFELDSKLEANNIGFPLDASQVKTSMPHFGDCQTGYTTSFTDPITYSNRYFKYKFDDDQYKSIPYILFETQQLEFSSNPYEIKELLFILRNKDIIGEERAVLVYEAADILSGNLPLEYLENLVENKIVFIGLFDDHYTKYGKNIDKFVTPVQSDLSGVLLLANAYLNLVADIDIQPSPWSILFLINFIIAWFIISNFRKDRNDRYNAIIIFFFNLILSILFFHFVAIIFFVTWHIKLSLGFSLLVFQHKFLLYSYYDSFF